MKFLKTGLVISLAVLFSIACSTSETTNSNASRTANQNGSTPVAVTTPANANEPARPGATPPGSSTDPVAMFKVNNCVACHGEDGKGTPSMKAKLKDLPDFTDAAWQKKATDAQMIETIKNGHQPMPAYKDKLNDDQIKMLVAHVRSFVK